MVNDESRQLIAVFARRSDRFVLGLTILFGTAGMLIEFGLSMLGLALGAKPDGFGNDNVWIFWGVLCFLAIPPIHYLCRHVVALEKRLEKLEKSPSDAPSSRDEAS